MSQYVAPAASLSERDVLLVIDQKRWTLIDQLYGNGKAGEIELMHDRITCLRTEVAAVKKWQDERSGASSLVARWGPILIAALALVVGQMKTD